MIEYYCGYPKCGKSEYAEKELEKLSGKVLYVGTLPDIPLYQATIFLHKQRRPPSWALYECCGDPIQDLAVLSKYANCYDGMLVDGLSYYLHRALYFYSLDHNWLEAFHTFLTQCCSLPLRLLFVDQPVSFAAPELRRICCHIHEELYKYSNNMFFVSDGAKSIVDREFLRKRDDPEDEHWCQRNP